MGVRLAANTAPFTQLPTLSGAVALDSRTLRVGYSEDAHTLVNDALFDCSSKEVVLVRGIDIFSMCEHHMLPFYGRVHIAYIPNGKVLGWCSCTPLRDVYLPYPQRR